MKKKFLPSLEEKINEIFKIILDCKQWNVCFNILIGNQKVRKVRFIKEIKTKENLD